MKHILARQSIDDPYHVDIIRDKLMRMLPAVLPNLIDELAVTVPDCIPIDGHGAYCFQPMYCGPSEKKPHVTMLSRLDHGEGATDNAEDHSPFEQSSLCRASSMCVSALELSRVQFCQSDQRCCIGRNQEYVDLAVRFAEDAMKDKFTLILFPRFLRS